MPATRSQADAVAGGAEPEVADLLEDAAAELSAESAARKAAEHARVLCWIRRGGRRSCRRRGRGVALSLVASCLRRTMASEGRTETQCPD